jgi:hypothetical protein
MRTRFDSIAMIPLTLVIGVALGIELSTGKFPLQFVERAAIVILGTWMALVTLDCLIWIIQETVASVVDDNPLVVPDQINVVHRDGDEADLRQRVIRRRNNEMLHEFFSRVFNRPARAIK